MQLTQERCIVTVCILISFCKSSSPFIFKYTANNNIKHEKNQLTKINNNVGLKNVWTNGHRAVALGKPLSNYATSTSQNTVSSKFYNDIQIINFLLYRYCNINDPLIVWDTNNAFKIVGDKLKERLKESLKPQSTYKQHTYYLNLIAFNLFCSRPHQYKQ